FSNFLPDTPTTAFTLRIEFEGTNLRAKAWTLGDPEPLSWGINITNSVFDDSPYGFFLEGFSSSTRSWFVDNVSYYDFNAPDPGPQTVSVDSRSETETSLAVTLDTERSALVSSSSETELSNSVTVVSVRDVLIPNVSETESSGTVSSVTTNTVSVIG